MKFKVKFVYCNLIIFILILLCVLIIKNSQNNKLIVKEQDFKLNNSNSSFLFCIILTKFDNLNTKTKTIYETWASKCDNYRFILTLPNNIIENSNTSKGIELNINYMNILQPPNYTSERYNALTDKIFLTLNYLFINDYYKRYKWYLKADDDSFIFVNNLRDFLSTKNSSLPVTYGYDYKLYVQMGYHSGGAGYVLSNEAFNRLGSILNKNYSFCENNGIEDVDVALCLRKLQVYPNKSIDDFGRERFHPVDLVSSFRGDFLTKMPWLNEYALNPIQFVR